jgi:hypothetical protein
MDSGPSYLATVLETDMLKGSSRIFYLQRLPYNGLIPRSRSFKPRRGDLLSVRSTRLQLDETYHSYSRILGLNHCSIRSRRWTGEERESDSQGITSSSLSTSFQLSVYSLLVISFPPLPWLRIIANSLNHPSSPPLVSSVEPNRPCLSWSAHCTDPELNQFSVSSLLFYYETDVSTRCTRMKRRY